MGQTVFASNFQQFRCRSSQKLRRERGSGMDLDRFVIDLCSPSGVGEVRRTVRTGSSNLIKPHCCYAESSNFLYPLKRTSQNGKCFFFFTDKVCANKKF